MLKGLSVPTHRIDAPGVYIYPQDGAWDQQRLAAEDDAMVEISLAEKKRETLEDAARQAGKGPDDLSAEEREAAVKGVELDGDERRACLARHPVSRYFAGETRFDLQAIDQGPGGQVRITDYIKPGETPTMFHLRRVGYQTRARLDPSIVSEPIARLVGWVRAGVERITCGATVLWETSEKEPSVPDVWLERICGADAYGNLLRLAGACAKYSRPLDEVEGKRSA